MDGFIGQNIGSSAAQSVILMAIVVAADGDPVPLHRAQGAVLMVENRPWQSFFTHLILILGVAIVVFPVYVAFIASTQAPGTFLRGVDPAHAGAEPRRELLCHARHRLPRRRAADRRP
jgi:hypothetical protein